MATRFDMEAFSRDHTLVAVLVLADEVFSFLSRALTMPSACVAMVEGESGQPSLVPAGQSVEASGARALFFAKTSLLPLEYAFSGLDSKDGYEFDARVRLSVRVVPERAELAALRRAVFTGENRIDLSHLRDHCEEAVRTAVSAFTKTRDAAALSSPETWSQFDGLLTELFKPVGFESGLALGPDPRITLESPAYAEARQADQSASLHRKHLEAEEQLRAAAVEARARHLEDLEKLLERVRDIADKSGSMDVATLVKTFDAGQRGVLYEGLVALNQTGSATRAILVAAGNELIWFDPASPQTPFRRQDLTSDLGPLRSIRLSQDGNDHLLMVGARNGIHLISAHDGKRVIYTLSCEEELRGGVNSAALLGDSLYATHSEVGLIRWERSRPDAHEVCLADVTDRAKSIRNVQADESGRIWFTVNDRVISWEPTGDTAPVQLAAPADVTVLIVSDGHAYAGLENGAVVRWNTANTKNRVTLRSASGEAVRSLNWLGGGGIPRLLIADGRPLLDLQVLGDTYRGEYRCHRHLRWGFAAEDYIVGVDSSRDRIIIWRIDTPAEPAQTVSIGRICGRSIHDVALLPKPPETD
ncbi:MAG: hypothetical protein ABII12_06740 [Planctomycetota bacterium]